MLEEINYPNNIGMVRKVRGLTQAYVAEQIGVSRPKYIEIERGQKELTVSQLEKLKEVLDASFEDLIGIDTGRIDFRKFIKEHTTSEEEELELGGGSIRAFYDEDEKEWWLSAKDVIKILGGLSASLSEALDKYSVPPKNPSK
ncbi:helix-turn-helix transcriptional regulator [Candidatus Saccharibacteria bacterium]|nr:helix-turn-helix transcriptional regulator [Candidatus Saccharibacteria bacterium]